MYCGKPAFDICKDNDECSSKDCNNGINVILKLMVHIIKIF